MPKRYHSKIIDKEELKEIYQHVELSKDHGWIERREHFITYNVDFIYGKENWKNLNLIGMTRNYREINGEVSIQEKFYISDLNCLPKSLQIIQEGIGL